MHSEDIIYSYRLPNGDSPLRQLSEIIASPPIEMLLIKVLMSFFILLSILAETKFFI